MAKKRYKKSSGKMWVIMSFILFILLIVLGLKLLNEHAIIDTSWTLQQNWDSLVAWWNALPWVVDIKGWF